MANQKREEWWPQVRMSLRLYSKRKKQKYLPKRQREEVQAIDEALEWAKSLPDGDARYRIAMMYHIKQSHSLPGAADAVGYTPATAYIKNREFMQHLAETLGYRNRRTKKQCTAKAYTRTRNGFAQEMTKR